MSRVEKKAQVELEQIGGKVLSEVVRDQMQKTVSALRAKLAAAKDASAKATATDNAAMKAYLGVRSPSSLEGDRSSEDANT